MAVQQLIDDVLVSDLAPGASVTLPHGITINGRPSIPQQVMPDRVTLIRVIALTKTDVTFHNDGSYPETAVFRCLRYHTFQAKNAATLTWQGQAAAVVAQLPFLNADPSPPIPVGYQWFVHTLPTPQTGLFGRQPVDGGVGDLVISVLDPLFYNFSLFGDTTNWGNLTFTLADAPVPIVITPAPPMMGHMDVLVGNDKNWNDIVAAINAWAVANLSPGVAPIASLSNPADGTLPLSPAYMGLWMSSDAASEGVHLRVQGIAQIFDIQLS